MTTKHNTTEDNSEIIAAATHEARSKPNQKRGTFPKFIVKIDGGSNEIKSTEGLRKFLSSVRLNEPCWIFRNGGYGATIAFDKPDFVS